MNNIDEIWCYRMFAIVDISPCFANKIVEKHKKYIYQLTPNIQLCNSYSRAEGLSLCDLYSRAFINVCLASSLSVYVKLAVLFARIVKSRFGTSSFPFFFNPGTASFHKVKSNRINALLCQ